MGSLWLLPLVALSAEPAPEGNPHLPRALEQIRQFREEAALETLEQAKRWPYNTGKELAQVNVAYGWAYAELHQEEKARSHFELALLLDPRAQLPADASPTLRALWERAGGKPRVSDVARTNTQASAPASSAAVPMNPEVHDTPGPPSRRWPRWVGAALMGVGAAVLVTGAVFGARSADSLRRSREEPKLLPSQELHGRASAEATTANALFVTGAVLGAGGAVTLAISF